MAKMVRKQVYIRPEDQRLLTRAAKMLDVPESEVIRRGISVIAAQAQSAKDRRAWDDVRRSMEARQKLPTLPGKRSWTREDLYDDA
jgi:hypothetical protein